MHGSTPSVSVREAREPLLAVVALNIALAISAGVMRAYPLAVLTGLSALVALEAALRRPPLTGRWGTTALLLGTYAVALLSLFAPRLLRWAAG